MGSTGLTAVLATRRPADHTYTVLPPFDRASVDRDAVTLTKARK